MSNITGTMMDNLVDGVDKETAPIWFWLLMIFISCVSFWAQATVTEERFVPALNVIANEYNIPSDVAGATLMAAGASSPELFSSFVALFITHSALGLGTIVGSEIFNQLIICSGAVFASQTGHLQLDKAIVTREVGFYALSIVLLYYALRDRELAEDGSYHIFISFADACILFAGYIAYVLVCANMDRIVALFSSTSDPLASEESKKKSYGAVDGTVTRASFRDLPDMPFIREAFEDEPASNFQPPTVATTGNGTAYDTRESLVSFPESLRVFSDGKSLRNFLVKVEDEKPSDEHSLFDIEFNGKESRLSCFLWQRSVFYNRAKFAKNMWHLRWFSFTKDQISSVPNRSNYKKHGLHYPKFKKFEFDDKRYIIRIPNSPGHKRKDFYFMAPSDEVFNTVVDKMGELVNYWEAHEEEVLAAPDQEKENDDSEDVDLTEFPLDGSTFTILVFYILYPLRFLMQNTMGDVRTLDSKGNPTATLGKAYLAVVMCLVWLIIGSYAMVASLEKLADLMDIPDAIVGVTVSAAGTSLPNYVASKVAAQKGFGNMAVSNAFGSNTFNIMVGLGLPWLLYIGSTGFKPYHALHDDGITQSVEILGTVLLLFVVLVVPTGFVLYKWHGYLFILLYIAYLAFAIVPVVL